jgi:hypothetical protein
MMTIDLNWRLLRSADAEYRKSLGLILTRPYVVKLAPVSCVIQPHDVDTQRSAAAARAAICMPSNADQRRYPPWLVRTESTSSRIFATVDWLVDLLFLTFHTPLFVCNALQMQF